MDYRCVPAAFEACETVAASTKTRSEATRPILRQCPGTALIYQQVVSAVVVDQPPHRTFPDAPSPFVNARRDAPAPTELQAVQPAAAQKPRSCFHQLQSIAVLQAHPDPIPGIVVEKPQSPPSPHTGTGGGTASGRRSGVRDTDEQLPAVNRGHVQLGGEGPNN